MPKDFNYQEISQNYNIPSNLIKLGKGNESAFLTLKLVEIIGEDEAYNLDPETIYFITHLLNQNNLRKNKKRNFDFSTTTKKLITLYIKNEKKILTEPDPVLRKM